MNNKMLMLWLHVNKTLAVKIIHWLMALVISVQLVIGYYASSLPLSLERYRWLNWHKSLGFLIFVFLFVRLGVRINAGLKIQPTHSRAPSLLPYIAALNHTLIYISLFSLGLSGWLMASFANLPISILGIKIPPLVEKNRALLEACVNYHHLFVLILTLCLSAHILAAFYHHWFRKDSTLRDMF